MISYDIIYYHYSGVPPLVHKPWFINPGLAKNDKSKGTSDINPGFELEDGLSSMMFHLDLQVKNSKLVCKPPEL